MSRRPNFTLILTFWTLLAGIWIFRSSPWMREARPADRSVYGGVRQVEAAGKPPVQETSEYPIRPKQEAIVALANANVAEKVGIPAAKRAKIERLVMVLEEKTVRHLTDSVQEWKQTGGFQKNQMPELLVKPATHLEQVAYLKNQTERAIFEMLTPEEQRRWMTFYYDYSGTNVLPNQLRRAID